MNNKKKLMICAAALAAGACAQSPQQPVVATGEASPEFIERLDNGEFKAYEVEQLNAPAQCPVEPPDRRHETTGASCAH